MINITSLSCCQKYSYWPTGCKIKRKKRSGKRRELFEWTRPVKPLARYLIASGLRFPVRGEHDNVRPDYGVILDAPRMFYVGELSIFSTLL